MVGERRGSCRVDLASGCSKRRLSIMKVQLFLGVRRFAPPSASIIEASFGLVPPGRHSKRLTLRIQVSKEYLPWALIKVYT